MVLPVIRKKEKQIAPAKPPKKKYALNQEIVVGIERCKAKVAAIKKALKGSDEELDSDIDADIEKSIRNLVKKYEKSLDQIINDKNIIIGNQASTDSTENATANLFPTDTTTSNPILNHLHSGQ
jgi:hypothetical protein